jgi:hypothetical protein
LFAGGARAPPSVVALERLCVGHLRAPSVSCGSSCVIKDAPKNQRDIIILLSIILSRVEYVNIFNVKINKTELWLENRAFNVIIKTLFYE